jgi:hypothetical protein
LQTLATSAIFALMSEVLRIACPHMRALRIATLGTAAILSGCSSSPGLLGRYLDTDFSDRVMIVQIDSVENHSVHGLLISGNMGSNNDVVQWTQVPIAGTLHDKALSLTIENGTSNSMLNGTVVPSGLDLTMLSNGRAVRHIFKREDNAQAGKDV